MAHGAYLLRTNCPQSDPDAVEPPPASWLPEVDSGIIDKHRSKKSLSTNDELDDDEEANTGWKLVPFYGVAMLFLFRQCFRPKAGRKPSPL
jgi:hypothetical protein